MNIGVIVQARMSSQRLPGKVLQPVAGKPMLQYLLERLERCQGVAEVVVATSTDQSDTPVAEFCRRYGVACQRGPLLDVAGRFKEVLDVYQFDGFVRISGDSPLLDCRLIERGLEIFRQDSFDLVTNVLTRTFPKGESFEIVRGSTFKAAYASIQTAEELEHVTKHFYQNQSHFNIFNITSPQFYGDIQLAVDSSQDLALITAIVGAMSRPHWQYGLEDVLQLYRQVAKPAEKVKA